MRVLLAAVAAWCVITFVNAGSASAALIEQDWLTPGDRLLTLDTSSGLEWLDISQTNLEGFPPGATVKDRFEEVAAQTAAGELFEGFTVASIAQTEGLLESANIDIASTSFARNEVGASLLLRLIGASEVTPSTTRLWGVLADEVTFGNSQEQAGLLVRVDDFLGGTRRASGSVGGSASNLPFPNPNTPGIGVMLVRAIPEPASWLSVVVAMTTVLHVRPQ